MMSIQDPRAEYWDYAYRKYWEERVAESATGGESQVQSGDARTEGDWVYDRVFERHPLQPGKLLDVGCAWGRMFPMYLDRGLEVSGIDISQSMIDAARETYGTARGINELRVATAENLPFEAAAFDNVICVAVFDATYQHQALAEFLRVLKPGGRLYLTGKSDRYFPDDNLALTAERGARLKGHPNHFTDVPAMRGALAAVGCSESGRYAFARRGDFASFAHTEDFGSPFYEWLLVVERGSQAKVPPLPEFASEYSRTFREVYPEESS